MDQINEVVAREQGKLRNFIRKQVSNETDAEDILQEVFFELVEAYDALTPLRQTGAWLYRVARNRITDLFRRRRTEALRRDPFAGARDDGLAAIEEWLPSGDAGPEAAYARRILLEELDVALEELPAEQKAVFIAHEVEGRSFKELSAATGVAVNTLISRKHYAVLHLRKRLQTIYKEYVNV